MTVNRPLDEADRERDPSDDAPEPDDDTDGVANEFGSEIAEEGARDASSDSDDASESGATDADPLAEPQLLVVPPEESGKRLDVFLAERYPYHSRMSLRRAISAGGVLVNGRQVRPACKLQSGKQVSVRLPEQQPEGPIPEAIPLDILFEDPHFAVINKPPGMVVHPARGHWKGTLTAALAHHFESLSDVGGPVRPGVVHRLDRDTSGVIIVAKTNRAHFALSQQFEDRVTEKEYLTIVVGQPDRDRDVIEAPIGIHPYQREKMAIRAGHPTSKPARTFYEVLERFDGFALVRVFPKTGRTHQIRVHLAHIGNPVLCDKQYGGRSRITLGDIRREPTDETVLLERQALHAHRLKVAHPVTRAPQEFFAPLPADIQRVLDALRQFRARGV